MKTGLKVILFAGGALATYELIMFLKETNEKQTYYAMARDYSDSVGKPLLRIGMKRAAWEPPNGDVTLDIDPAVLSIPGGVVGDERSMPFYDKQFGACFNEHTLEHLHSIEDVEDAVSEAVRVADIAVLLAPSPYRISTTLFEPDHQLRLWFRNNKIFVEKNKYITGLGGNQGAPVSRIHYPVPQVMILQNEMPEILPHSVY